MFFTYLLHLKYAKYRDIKKTIFSSTKKSSGSELEFGIKHFYWFEIFRFLHKKYLLAYGLLFASTY